MLVHPLCCNDDRAGEIGPTFHFMTRHDLVLANDNLDLDRRPNFPRYTPRHTEIFPDHRDHLALRRSLGWGERLRVDIQCHLA
jgi:hypothetical protein